MNPSNTRRWLTTVLAALGLFTAISAHAQTDTSLTFTSSITDQFYNVDREVNVTLPEATNGTGTLTYMLTRTDDGSPTLPGGLDLIGRTLTGTPTTTTVAAVTLTYTVTDSATSATAALTFTVTVLSGAFITTWRIVPNTGTDTDNNIITIPIHAESSYRYTVNWGEGPEDTTIYTSSTMGATHIYPDTDTIEYKVSITGVFPRIHFNFGEDRDKIISIDQWGNNVWDSMEQAFTGCSNLGYTATDTPDLTRVTNMNQMFQDAVAFNGAIGGWNVSNVTDMASVFLGASKFNQDIREWKVGNVTNMVSMFSRATEFNQDIGDWDVSKVTSTAAMFFNAPMFNQDISRWNISSIDDDPDRSMANMFHKSILPRVGLSDTNYDKLLVGWSTIDNDESTPQGVTFDAGNSQYCNQAARDILTKTHGWMITDAGRVGDVTCGFQPQKGTEIRDQSVAVNTDFSYIFPEDAFRDDDADDTLRYEADENPELNWLDFNAEERKFSGTPGSEDVGETMITVTAFDQLGANTTQTFTITVVDRAPTVNAPIESTVVFVGEPFSYPIPLNTFSDDDIAFGDTLTYTANINPRGNWLNFDTPMFTFFGTPTRTFSSISTDLNNINVTTITVTATDLNNNSVDTTFTVTVGNRIPAVNAPIESTIVFVGVPFSYPIPLDTFSDDDIAFGDTLTYTVNRDPQDNWLSFDTPTLTLFGTPTRTFSSISTDLNNINVTTITVTATDLINDSISIIFTVTVGNRIPMVDEGLASTSVFVGEPFSYLIPLDTFSDGDIAFDDTLTYTVDRDPQDNWLNFDTPTFTLFGTPTRTFSSISTDLNNINVTTITVTATDSSNGSISIIFTVTVGNRIPIVTAPIESMIVFLDEPLPFSYPIPLDTFSDDDIAFGDTLTYTVNRDPQDNWLSFDTPTLTFSGIPTNTTDIGVTTITVTATDLINDSISIIFTVTVGNRIPMVDEGLASTSLFVGAEFSYEIPENAFSDGDIAFGDTLTYTANINSQSTWLSFDTPTLTFSSTPTSADDIGISTITVTAMDLNGGSVNSSFTVTVVNRVPTVNAGFESTSVFVGVEFSYKIPGNAFSDGDIMYDDTLTYTVNINPNPPDNWLSFDTPTLTFSSTTPPNLSDIGITTITVTATDLNGGNVNSSFTVTVVNRVPTVNEGLASTSVFVGAEFSYEIPGNAFSDDDIAFDDTLTYTANINSQGNWLTFASETRIFTGSPRLIDIGISTITVTATDLNGGSVNSSFTVTVNNRIPTIGTGLKDQEAFVGRKFSYEIPEDAFIDPDGGTLSYSTDANLRWLMFSTGNRTFSGTPPTGTEGNITTITVTVTDPNGASLTSSFTLMVDIIRDLIFRVKVFLEGGAQ